MFDQQCPKICSVKGPTPYSVGIIYRDGKPPTSDTRERLFGLPTSEQKIEQYREKVQEQQKNDKFNVDWATQIQKKMSSGEFKREVDKELNEYQEQLRERKLRLHKFLEDEENYLISEMESKVDKREETVENVVEFKKQREERRQQLVREKLDMQFAENSVELRTKLSAQIADSVLKDRRQQIREQECLRRMKKLEDEYYDCLWKTDYLNKMRREEKSALERHARNMEMVTILNDQVKNKSGGKEERERLIEEEKKFMEDQRHQLEMEKQREKEEKLRKKLQMRETIQNNISEVKAQKFKQQLENDVYDDLYANMNKDVPPSDTKTKQERLKEALQFLEQVAIEKRERRERERESERLICEDAERLWQKEMAKRSEDREWREKLMRDVLEERKLQLQLKIEENALQQKYFMDEVNEFHKVVEFNKQIKREEEEKHKMSIEKYRKDILKQIEDQKEQEKSRREQMDSEYETYKNQEEDYENKLKEIGCDPRLVHVHQMRLKTSQTAPGETDTMLSMMMRIKSLQDIVDVQKKDCSSLTSTSKRGTCKEFNNILAYYNED